MARVRTPSGDTFDEDNPVALNYYNREPGYEILGDVAEAMDGEVVVVVSEPPNKSALKPEWVDYAKTVDPERDPDEIEALTVAELHEQYGGDE